VADPATSSVTLHGSYLGGFFMSAVVLELSKYRSLLSHVQRIRRPRKKLYYLPERYGVAFDGIRYNEEKNNLFIMCMQAKGYTYTKE